MHRILVLEDDHLMREAFKDALETDGFEVVACSHGRHALEAAASLKPDLALLDVELPDMSGLDVCSELKSNPATRDIPVVIMTGKVREVVDQIRGLDLGAEDYLLKPISIDVLRARIRSILKSRIKAA